MFALILLYLGAHCGICVLGVLLYMCSRRAATYMCSRRAAIYVFALILLYLGAHCGVDKRSAVDTVAAQFTCFTSSSSLYLLY